MEQGNRSDNERAGESAPHVQPASQQHQAHSAPVQQLETPSDRLTILQRAFLLEQLAEGGVTRSRGELNQKIPAAAQRDLQLAPEVANRVRSELAEQGYLEVIRHGRTISYRLTDSGRTYLGGLERPMLKVRTNRATAVDESAITDEVREGQKAYLLLQLLDAKGRTLTRGEANKFPTDLTTSLGLSSAIGNYRRGKLAEQGYIRVSTTKRTEEHTLTDDGLDYLAANTKHLNHATFKVKGSTLNALVAAVRELSFDREQPIAPTAPARPAPGQAALAEAVLAEFEELRRERHSRSGLVPIHEVRQRIADRFGPAGARHDVLDQVILNLWREKRLGLEAISDLNEATEQQLIDGIPGTSGTLFYLEAPHGQPVTSESV
jgi:DNA-binding PadR family transcriptional regulator